MARVKYFDNNDKEWKYADIAGGGGSGNVNVDLSNYFNKQEVLNLIKNINSGVAQIQYRINDQAEDYTTTSEDFDGVTLIRCLKETDQAITVTKPDESFKGNTLTIRKVGWDETSTVTILPGDGVTLTPSDGNVLRRSGSTVGLLYVGNGVFDIFGELA